ncbi:MAG: ABC transporter ATP-binding protein [Candidatus Cloacimonadales bacterium]|jgi:ABC-2 type transport system ATP-binding protein|nr:ABC transporter ATP-binding protein [Candidatus Cloacimonadota bacterium]MDD3502031.1 ABC transporter ATP-binding protein [Candidatus Cloacimonadota bacterium]MDX9976793.1 ABC transporter ATP-binding protein [Candidatus Cloacimonadales bacterium]
MISVKTTQLTKKFGSFTAVDAVDLEVYKGEIFGFLGANGAGKSTMIRMLCGLLMPSSGEALIDGLDIYKESELIKKRIGYMSQKFSLYNDLTVAENIEFYGGVYSLDKKLIRSKKEEIAVSLNLKEEMKRLTRDVPVGLKQRLALACAMLHDPKIIFLDEPTSGVDPKVRKDFWNIIYDLSEHGKTVFVTTHFMEEAEYCHRLSIMQDGRIIALDSPENMKAIHNEKTIQDVFIKLIKRQNNDEI